MTDFAKIRSDLIIYTYSETTDISPEYMLHCVITSYSIHYTKLYEGRYPGTIRECHGFSSVCYRNSEKSKERIRRSDPYWDTSK